VTEIKTIDTFSNDEVWYRGSRALQSLGAAYALNLPVILATQHRFKFFVENNARDSMYSFPGVFETGAIRGPEGTLYDSLMKVLTIVIVSKWQYKGPVTPPPKIQSTLLVNEVNPKNPPSHLKPPNNSNSTKRTSSTCVFLTVDHNYGTRSKPKFKSGTEDGESLYTDIWVFSENELDALDLDSELFV
jgi:hypothetical protein